MNDSLIFAEPGSNKIDRALSTRIVPNRLLRQKKRAWAGEIRAAKKIAHAFCTAEQMLTAQQFLAAWMESHEGEIQRERELETSLKCLRKLRIEFTRFEDLAKASACFPWAEEMKREKERERDLDVRLRLLTGRFGNVAKVAGECCSSVDA